MLLLCLALVLVALGITNIWQPLITYTLVYTHVCDSSGSSMLRDGDCDCCVHCVDSVAMQFIQRIPLQALGSKWQSNWHRRSPVLLERIVLRSQYRACNLSKLHTAEAIQNRERFEQLCKWLMEKLEVISCTSKDGDTLGIFVATTAQIGI